MNIYLIIFFLVTVLFLSVKEVKIILIEYKRKLKKKIVIIKS